MKVSAILQGATMKPVPKAKRMSVAGWYAGYLVVGYKGSAAKYIYGPNVDAGELDKLMRAPFPESLLDKLKKKHGWQTHKVA